MCWLIRSSLPATARKPARRFATLLPALFGAHVHDAAAQAEETTRARHRRQGGAAISPHCLDSSIRPDHVPGHDDDVRWRRWPQAENCGIKKRLPRARQPLSFVEIRWLPVYCLTVAGLHSRGFVTSLPNTTTLHIYSSHIGHTRHITVTLRLSRKIVDVNMSPPRAGNADRLSSTPELICSSERCFRSAHFRAGARRLAGLLSPNWRKDTAETCCSHYRFFEPTPYT